MPEQIRFLLDEHVPAAVAAGLRQKGIEVSTVQELGRSGLPDLEQVELGTELFAVLSMEITAKQVFAISSIRMELFWPSH